MTHYTVVPTGVTASQYLDLSLNELTGLPLEVSQNQHSRVVDYSPEPGAGLSQDLPHPGPRTGDALRVGHVEVSDDDQPAGVGADVVEVVSALAGGLGVAGGHHDQPGGVAEGGQTEAQPGVTASDEDCLVRVPGRGPPITWGNNYIITTSHHDSMIS